MKKIGLLLVTLLIAASGFAEKAMIANCEEGKGCTFQIGETSAEEIGVIIDDLDIYENTKSGDVIVFGKKKNGEEIIFKETGKTRSQIDREWGGDGYTMIYPFNPVLQPMDGKWRADYGNVTGSSCFVDVASIFKKSLKGLAGAGNITFKKPFTPAQLFPSGHMKWRQVGFSKYVGIIDFGGGASSFMKMKYTINITNEKTIESVYDVSIQVPTKGTCTNRIPVTFSLVKASKPNKDWEKDVQLDDDDLLEVKTKGDDLLPIEPSKRSKAKVERIEAKVDRIED